ncbi:Transmembrane protein 258 [Glycine max]|nr:Transmembrane protein 258 [Glycine max]
MFLDESQQFETQCNSQEMLGLKSWAYCKCSAPKPITSPVPDSWYPTLSVFTLAIGLVLTASFFIYEATSSRKSRSLVQELTTGAVASVFLGFGSLFLLLASGVYV